MITREEKVKILNRWMAYFCLSFDDLDIVSPNDSLDKLEENQLDLLLENAEEDRARHIADGVPINEDWSSTEEENYAIDTKLKATSEEVTEEEWRQHVSTQMARIMITLNNILSKLNMETS
jgi:hypothetical protein